MTRCKHTAIALTAEGEVGLITRKGQKRDERASSHESAILGHTDIMNNYRRTDLAAEWSSDHDDSALDGVTFAEETHGVATISHVELTTSAAAELLGKPMGSYTTISFSRPWELPLAEIESLSLAVGKELRRMIHTLSPQGSVLVVGLGNRKITVDTIGTQVADMLEPTMTCRGELRSPDNDGTSRAPSPTGAITCRQISILTPGVRGDTGIESAEIVAAVVERVRPALVIAIDALCARETERLCRTVQLTDTGIAPGSGVGAARMALNSETLGIPVIAIGVPTIIESATLVYDALEAAGVEDFSHTLDKVLSNDTSFHVSVKEADIATRELAQIVAAAVGVAMG